nr:hypothetical protein [Campylobacter sp. MIT 99-7217]
MTKSLEILIIAGLILSAAITAWAVLTANHLQIG